MASPSKRRYLKVNRKISLGTRNFIDIMSTVGFTSSQSARLIATQCDGLEKLDCIIQDINNLRRDKREDIKEYDADLLFEHFESMKAKDEFFFMHIK